MTTKAQGMLKFLNEGKLKINLESAEKIVALLKKNGYSNASYDTEYGFSGIYNQSRYAQLTSDNKGFCCSLRGCSGLNNLIMNSAEVNILTEEINEVKKILDGIRGVDSTLV